MVLTIKNNDDEFFILQTIDEYIVNTVYPNTLKMLNLDYELLINRNEHEIFKLLFSLDYVIDYEFWYEKIKNKNDVELNKYILKKSFDYRNIEFITNILNYISSDDILDIKFMDFNMCEYLCRHGWCSGGKYNFASKKNNYPNEDNDILQIFELIVKKNQNLITDRAYDIANIYKNFKMIKIMNIYDQFESESYCYICFSSRQKDSFLNNICECKMSIHLRCAQEMILKNGLICKSCKKYFKKNEENKRICMTGIIQDDIFFPHINIYPVVAFAKQYKTVSSRDALTFSILFLQISEFDKIVDNNLSKLDIYNIFNQQNNGIGNIIDGKIKLLENMCSNYPRSLNKDKYDHIEYKLNNIMKNTE